MPIRSREVVPEFPQSMGPSGCLGPSAPHPVTPPANVPSIWRSKETFAPKAETAPMVERTSAESRTPVKREVPSAIAAKSTARWDMDLSPGTRAAPSRGAPKGSMRVIFESPMTSTTP